MVRRVFIRMIGVMAVFLLAVSCQEKGPFYWERQPEGMALKDGETIIGLYQVCLWKEYPIRRK